MHDEEDHDHGLSHDLPTLLSRRSALALFGGAGLLGAAGVLTGCSLADEDPKSATSSSSAATSAGESSAPADGREIDATASGGGEIPEETSGPYPADGSNGVNVLTATGIVRGDIRSSFGNASGVAEGVPLTFTLTVVDVSGNDDAGTPLAGAAVYAWHCDRDGNYSLYSDAAADENYLRGVQETDGNGAVTFTSIYPACYDGRWPHIHFEVYRSLDDATSAGNRLRTSQLALPKAVCETVYATEGYESSTANLARVSLDTDNVFRDGYSLQLAKVSGSVRTGYAARLRVPV